MKAVVWKEYLNSIDLNLVDILLQLARTDYDAFRLAPQYSRAQLAYARSLYIIGQENAELVKYGLLWDYAFLFPAETEEVYQELLAKFELESKSAAATVLFKSFEVSAEFETKLEAAVTQVQGGTGSHINFLTDFYRSYFSA